MACVFFAAKVNYVKNLGENWKSFFFTQIFFWASITFLLQKIILEVFSRNFCTYSSLGVQKVTVCLTFVAYSASVRVFCARTRASFWRVFLQKIEKIYQCTRTRARFLSARVLIWRADTLYSPHNTFVGSIYAKQKRCHGKEELGWGTQTQKKKSASHRQCFKINHCVQVMTRVKKFFFSPKHIFTSCNFWRIWKLKSLAFEKKKNPYKHTEIMRTWEEKNKKILQIIFFQDYNNCERLLSHRLLWR